MGFKLAHLQDSFDLTKLEALALALCCAAWGSVVVVAVQELGAKLA